MPTHAVVAHRLPHRVRLRVDGKRGDRAYFSMLTATLAGLTGVSTVRGNSVTGSLTIEADDIETFIAALPHHNLDIIDETRPPVRQGAAEEAQASPSAPFLLVSHRELNPMFMLGVGLAALGTAQLVRGKVLAPATTLLWYAIDAFRKA